MKRSAFKVQRPLRAATQIGAKYTIRPKGAGRGWSG